MTLEELEEFYEQKELELLHLDDELGLVYDLTLDKANTAYRIEPSNQSTALKFEQEFYKQIRELAKQCDFKWELPNKSFRR